MTDTLASLRQEARKANRSELDALILRAWGVGCNAGRPQLPPELKGCGDHSCVVKGPAGMGTNGGCRCEPHALRVAVQQLKQWLRHEGDRRAAEMREQIALKLAAHSELLRLGDEKGPEAVATWCALAGAADIARGVPLEPPEAK